jgi:hypothetical protein
MLVGLESLRERFLIVLARLAEERSRIATSVGWILAQSSALAFAAVFAALGFGLDRLLADRPHNPADPGPYALLPPVLAAGAAAFVFLMGTWLSIVQATASRFESASVVRRLGDDWASTFALRLIFSVVLTAIAGLVTPQLTGRAVTFGAYVPLALLVLALPLLLSFRSYALMLAHPGRFAEVVRRETEQRIVRISASPQPTRSVANHFRRLVSSDFEVWNGLLLYGANKDPSLHYVITSNLALMMAFYWNRKTAIPAESAWFPQREVVSQDRTLRQIHDEQGLGQARTNERDAEWFERTALAVLERAAGRDTADNRTRSDVLAALAELLRLAWHRQETEGLKAVQARWTAERAVVSATDYEHWAAAVVNGLIGFADEVLRHQLRLDEVLPLKEYPEQEELAFSFLPAELLAALRRAAEEIDAETMVAGRIVTPLEALSSELDSELRQRQGELVGGAVRWVLTELEGVIESVVASNAATAPNAVADLFGAILLISNRSHFLSATEHAGLALAAATRLFPKTVQLLAKADEDKRLQLEREARVISLKAMRDNWSEAKSATLLAVKLGILNLVTNPKVTEGRVPPWIETFLVVGGMAFACGEVRGNRELVDLVIDTLRKATFDLAALARIKPALRELPMLGLGLSLTLEYHHYLGPVFDAVAKLGTRPSGGPGEIGFSEEINTESEWLRSRSLFPFGFSMEDAVEGFLDYAVPPGPDEATAASES